MIPVIDHHESSIPVRKRLFIDDNERLFKEMCCEFPEVLHMNDKIVFQWVKAM